MYLKLQWLIIEISVQAASLLINFLTISLSAEYSSFKSLLLCNILTALRSSRLCVIKIKLTLHSDSQRRATGV